MNTKTKLIAIGVVLAVVVVGAFVVRPWFQDRTVPTVVNEKIDRPALNFAFQFPSGDSAFSFFEPTLEPVSGGPEAVFIMMDAASYNEFQAVPGGETPPSMSIFVFPETILSSTSVASGTPNLDRMTRLRTWAEANSALTMYTRAAAVPEETKIDGTSALHYQVSDVYQHDMYVILHRGRYYVLVGQYEDDRDPIKSAFTELIRTLTFY